jgi:hypothetical protein
LLLCAVDAFALPVSRAVGAPDMVQILPYLQENLVSSAVSAEAGVTVVIPILRRRAEDQDCCNYGNCEGSYH